jgi:hypothetical protein
MRKHITRTTQIGDWIFEVKTVRALKVKNYGEPYSAVANLTVNGEQMYVDSHLSTNDEELSKDDFQAIYAFCQSMEMQNISYDRIKNGLRVAKQVEITPQPELKVCN